jgi:hypothetical protein
VIDPNGGARRSARMFVSKSVASLMAPRTLSGQGCLHPNTTLSTLPHDVRM